MPAYSLHMINQWLKQSKFVAVVSSSALSYLLTFCGAIFYARLLGKYQFGVYTFAYNIIQFFLLVNGLGVASGLLQLASKTNNCLKKQEYFSHAILIGTSFNLLLAVLITLYAFFVPLPIKGAKSTLFMMALFPVFRLYVDLYQAFLRANKQNSLLARFSVSASIIMLLSNICGIYYYGLNGFIASTYLAYLLTMLLTTQYFNLQFSTILFGAIHALKQARVTLRSISELLKFSLYATIANSFTQLIYILDVLMLGYIIKNAMLIAEYKVASIIPFALNFIPGIIVSFFYPDFASNNNNPKYLHTLYKRVQTGLLIGSVIISACLLIIAKPLVLFVFGSKYAPSVLPLQILACGFFIVAPFRILGASFLISVERVKSNMWINVIMGIFNLVINYVLIKTYGIIGAASGVIMVYLLSSIIISLMVRKFFQQHV